MAKNTKVYCKGGDLYGKGEGEFMPEAEAQKAGNREQKPVDGQEIIVEKFGGPDRTRICDLYRVKGSALTN